MITADTITDSAIRELRKQLGAMPMDERECYFAIDVKGYGYPWHAVWLATSDALQTVPYSAGSRRRAREFIADVLNARAVSGGAK